jgi:hypothetical protein
MPRLPVALALAAVLLLPAAAADAKPVTHRCKSADLRYPFKKGLPNDFGVFRLRITGGSCTTAHRVAKKWMDRLETSIRDRRKLEVPKRVEGFTFKTLAATEAQSFNERGRKSGTTVRFLYRVPNG